MHNEPSRWGLPIFIFSPLFITGIFILAWIYPHQNNVYLYQTVLPGICTAFSLISFFAGHFSYPRVHNMKVYLMGYLTGLTGTCFLVYSLFLKKPAPYIRVLYLLIFLNFILVLILPSYTKYRSTRRVTLAIIVVELGAAVSLYLMPHLIRWASSLFFNNFYHFGAWGSILWIGFVVLASTALLGDEFHLGGVISGCALFYVSAWLSPLLMSKNGGVELALFTFAPVYLVCGILIHWFSRMDHRVAYDPLLHVYNRHYCGRIIEEQSNINTAPPFGVVMIDIDHFKSINDTHGHQVGDQVLFHVAQTIQREVIPEGIVCRYGGEEIAVFFPRKHTKRIVPIIEKVRTEIENLRIGDGRKKVTVTVSCGISHRGSPSQSIYDVVAAADRALYNAKNSGRNRVKTWSPRSR